MFSDILSKAHWLKNRDACLIGARECRSALTDPQGHWHYARGDERLNTAVGLWVARAREAHRIGMGRRPVIANAVVIDGGLAVAGPLDAA